MAKITSKKLGAILAACEDAYADACREGYGENPAVSAAIAAVKSAHKNWGYCQSQSPGGQRVLSHNDREVTR
jgi:hypothetical protein